MDLIIGIIIWIVVGAIAGWLASVVMGTREGQSLGEDIIVGIVGGLLGGLVLELLGVEAEVSGINCASIVVAVIGAVVLLLILRAIRGTAQV